MMKCKLDWLTSVTQLIKRKIDLLVEIQMLDKLNINAQSSLKIKDIVMKWTIGHLE